MPSALKVSVAVIQVVMPGKVESIAVSSVQSMNAPLDRRNRRVGRTCARAASVTLGCNSVARSRPSPIRGIVPPPLPGTASAGVAAPLTGRGRSPVIACVEASDSFANTGPESSRSKTR